MFNEKASIIRDTVITLIASLVLIGAGTLINLRQAVFADERDSETKEKSLSAALSVRNAHEDEELKIIKIELEKIGAKLERLELRVERLAVESGEYSKKILERTENNNH